MKRTSRIYKFGAFEFDASQQELRAGADRVTLPAALNKLLLLLVSQPGELVTRDQIASALWDVHGTVDIANGINGAIRRLRMQLSGGSATEQSTEQSTERSTERYIETVVGTGYRFIAPVTVSYVERGDEGASAAAAAAEAEEPPPPTPTFHIEASGIEASSQVRSARWRRALPLAAGVLLLLAVAGLGWRRYVQRRAVQGIAGTPSYHWMPVTFKEIDDELGAQAVAPSGRSVAYSDRTGISVELIGSRQPRLLQSPQGLEVQYLSWFPDEQRLLVSGSRPGSAGRDDRSEAWVVPLDGRPPRLLMDDAALATVSPDGRRVAYARLDQSEVWVADADGQHTQRLIAGTPEETFSCLLWSARGDRLVVDRNSPGPPAHGVSDAARGAVEQLQQQDRWAYESYNATTGALLARQADLHFESAALLEDGRLIFPVHQEAQSLVLAMVRTDRNTGAVLGGAQVLPLSERALGAYSASGLNASNAGRSISAILDRPSMDVYIGELRQNASTGTPVLEHITRLSRHTGTSYPTAWSPDGAEVLFDDGDSGPSVVAGQRLEGGALKVYSNVFRAALGQYTPDGRWIMYMNFEGMPERVKSIERVPATGGKAAPVVVFASQGPGSLQEFHCSISAAGRCVLREAVGNKELVYYALDPVQGRGAELARTAWQPNVLGDWSVSPDGTTVAMADHNPAHPAVSLIRLASPAGGAPVSASAPAAAPLKNLPVEGFGTVLGPTWAADGKGMFVETHTDTGYGMVYVDLQGHTSLLLKRPEVTWAVPSRDGKRIALPGQTPLNRNVWLGTLRTGR